MVYNRQQLEMKKIVLIASLAIVSMFGMNYAYADNDVNDNTPQNTTLSEYCTASPEAYIYDISYYDDGRIIVTVGIKNREKRSYRVKVTPKKDIIGTIVEGAQFGTVASDSWSCQLTFHCYSGKESDAPYCKKYDFNVEIVD